MVLFPFSVIQKQPVTGMAQMINFLQSKRSLGGCQRSIKITSDVFEFATKGPSMIDGSLDYQIIGFLLFNYESDLASWSNYILVRITRIH